MPTELIRLCQQKRGMYSPWRSAAAMISSPLRAVNDVPLIVIGDRVRIGLRLGATSRRVGDGLVAGAVGRRLGGLRRRAPRPASGGPSRVAPSSATATTGSGASMTETGIRVRGLILASNSSRNSVSAECTGA